MNGRENAIEMVIEKMQERKGEKERGNECTEGNVMETKLFRKLNK